MSSLRSCLFIFLCTISLPLNTLAQDMLVGKVQKSSPTIIKALNLVMDRKNNLATFHNQVEVTRSDLSLFCDRMEVFFEATSPNKKEESIHDIYLYHKVIFKRGNKMAQAEHGRYDAKNELLFLNDHVTLTQGSDQAFGNHLIYDIKNDTVQLSDHAFDSQPSSSTSRVRAVFVPKQSTPLSLTPEDQ